MGYAKEYGTLLEAIAKEGDAIAMRYFRADELRVDRKGDGTAVTQADRAVEEMARTKVAASGLALDVLGEEMGGGDAKAASASGRARMIIDPIDGTEAVSGNTCWSRKEQLKSRSIGLPNRGTSRRSGSWSRKRGAALQTCEASERFIPGNWSAQMEKFTTKSWRFCTEVSDVANQLSQGIALQLAVSKLRTILSL